MLYYGRRDLANCIDADRVYYGDGRGECGICLHLPFKNHIAGSAAVEDHMMMLGVANSLVEFLLYKREIKGPELWDYNAEKGAENYEVCGDNPNSSGIIICDQNYTSGPKLQVFLDKTFGSNEISVRWKNQMVGDEKLLGDFESYLKTALSNGSMATGVERD